MTTVKVTKVEIKGVGRRHSRNKVPEEECTCISNQSHSKVQMFSLTKPFKELKHRVQKVLAFVQLCNKGQQRLTGLY